MFKQGKQFERNQRRYKRLVTNDKLNLISTKQLNIVQKLKSNKYAPLREGLTDMKKDMKKDMKDMEKPYSNKLDELDKEETAILYDLENRFNAKLEDYKTKYGIYLNEITSQQYTSSRKLYNKVVKYEGKYYYISDRGTIREFETEAQIPDNRGRGCPDFNNDILNAEQYSKFKNSDFGNKLKALERCDTTNKIVTDGTTSAWVDSGGFKHVFSSYIDRNATCKDTPLEISSEEFNAIESSTPYSKESKCITRQGNDLERELITINEELKSILHEIQAHVSNLQGKSLSLNNKIEKEKLAIIQKYRKLQQDKKKLSNMKTNELSYDAKIKEQNLLVPSVEMHNYIWVVLAGAFIVTAIYNLK
tara:strand:+ start:439 stop:1524 length:1086 start_codon:yes stop_codon:yes gene_type:complete